LTVSPGDSTIALSIQFEDPVRVLRIMLILTVFAWLPLAGCRKEAPRQAAVTPRVVTFSPALTDMAFAMGLGEHVVGVTTRCTLPAGEERPRVGDRFSVSVESILAVEPDVLMVQQNPADFAAVQRLRPAVKLEHFDIERLADIPAAMRRIGALCGDAAAGERAAGEFQSELDAVAKRVKGLPRPRVLFVIGYEKPGTGGRSSFIHDMIEAGGGQDAGEKYPRWADLGMETILDLAPDVLVCWVDPGQERQAGAKWQSFKTLPAVAKGKLFIVSDPNWTIPTGRLAKLTADLADMIHGTSRLSVQGWIDGCHAQVCAGMSVEVRKTCPRRLGHGTLMRVQ
jgi:iron complex transport system substrate-binding protein